MYFYTVSTAFFNVNLPCFWKGIGKPWVASDKYHFRYICWNTDVTKQQEFEIIMLYHSTVRVKITLSGRDDKHQWEWLADLSLCLFLHLVNHQRLCIYLCIFSFFRLKRLWHIYSLHPHWKSPVAHNKAARSILFPVLCNGASRILKDM